MLIEYTSGDDINKRGTQAADVIFAFDGADEVYGRGGNDRIFASGTGISRISDLDADFLDGGNDNDIFYNLGVEDRVSGGAGYNIAVFAMENALTRAVIRNSDFGLTNWRGINQFEGVLTQFNDILHAGFGLRSVDGGAGIDTYTANYSFLFGGRSENRSYATEITFDLSNNANRQAVTLSDGSIQRFSLSNFERFTIEATSGDDIIVLGHGNDVANGAKGRDIIAGLGGNDTLHGGKGNDTLDGGAGRDTLVGGKGNDTITLGVGLLESGRAFERDVAQGNSGNDTFREVDHLDSVNGGSGFDTIQFDMRGLNRDVRINVNSFTDSYRNIEAFSGSLGEGDDTAILGSTYETMSGHTGEDRLVLDYSSPELFNGMTLTGVALRLNTNGASLTQTEIAQFGGTTKRFQLDNFEIFDITGSNGNDTIQTSVGNDRIDALGGRDILSGGLGADVFVYRLNGGNDLIGDFAVGIDELHLDDALWGGGLSQQQVVDQFASVQGNGVTFDFGSGDRIVLSGLNDTNGLAGDLTLF